MQPNSRDYDVAVGLTHITVRRRGESAVLTGVLLGTEVIDGQVLCYADRLLLPAGEHSLNSQWSSTGCISTILLRKATPAELAAGRCLDPAIDQLPA